MDLVLMPIHGCKVLHSICWYCLIQLPLWKVKTDYWLQSCNGPWTDWLLLYLCFIDNCILNPISPLCRWNILCITQIACKLFCWSYNSYCRIYTVGLQQWSKVACLRLLILSRAPGVSSVEECRQVRRWVTNIAQGQYWFLLLLHGFIPPGPGQYGVLLPWLEEVT